MLNIVIPMAGAGSRFAKNGYKDPKPLIRIYDVPMIRLVISNLQPTREHRFIFICQKSHLLEYGLEKKLKDWSPGSIVIAIEGITEGAACTVLLSKQWINSPDPLMIANSDQYVDCKIDDYLRVLEDETLDGLIMTMKADDPKWSFVGLNAQNRVTQVVEKEVISDEATVGIYNFARGSDFVSAAESMVDKNLRVNGEFYVAPAYNQLIDSGHKIGICNVGLEANGMYGLGTPEDLNLFLGLPISKKAISTFA